MFDIEGVQIHHGDALELYEQWKSPMAIISDGAYGVDGFPSDPPTVQGLQEWYRPHVEAWTKYASPQTTLWFWNTEVGWATVHSLIENSGWEYRNCHIWDKGISHVAGNSNGKTLRKFPVTTEVCVQYTKRATFEVNKKELSMQEWLRYEWERSGLPLYKANEACGVKNAASRKYLTKDHLWYYPPPDAFQDMVNYANMHGDKSDRPYFSMNGDEPLSKEEWKKMRAKFNFKNGITNVWSVPANRGKERIKIGHKCVHLNQKPIKLIKRCILASTDEDDVVWEPFGGLCSAAVASLKASRRAFAAELVKEYFDIAVTRIEEHHAAQA
jgi:site-specific DNA-methyltransferase (adenine-specific)